MRIMTSAAAGVLIVGILATHAIEMEGANSSDLPAIQSLLAVPQNLARVSDAYWPDRGTRPDYILIQDVHRHPQVQQQIAALIEQGYAHWGVRKVFLEGAFTLLDMTVFHRVPKKTQALLLARLVEDGELSGPELAAVHIMEQEWRNPPVSPFQLFGLEDPELYRRNVKAYQAVVSQRPRALQELISVHRLHQSMNLQNSNALVDQLERTEALLRLRLTPIEYADYLKGKAAVPSTPTLDPAVRAAEEFYQVADRRSAVFLQQAAVKAPASQGTRILVVGGFHTAFMAGHLRQEGRSFVVLSPAVASGGDNIPYEKRLNETANVLAQALH
jgi:hypothetical protein